MQMHRGLPKIEGKWNMIRMDKPDLYTARMEKNDEESNVEDPKTRQQKGEWESKKGRHMYEEAAQRSRN